MMMMMMMILVNDQRLKEIQTLGQKKNCKNAPASQKSGRMPHKCQVGYISILANSCGVSQNEV
jgi:hypothetical protein